MANYNLEAGNTPIIGKRMLFFVAKPEGGTKPWPCKILDNYGAKKKAPRAADAANASVNKFCTAETTPADGQTLYQFKIETADGDHIVDAYADPVRSPGTVDEYKDGDRRV
jgi:hypothetical protein